MINRRSIVLSALLSFLMIPISMNAQQLFTLEDLNYGGKNYHNLSSKNMWLTWWGDQLIQTDVEECYTIDAKTGKKEVLFTLDEVNKWIKSDDDFFAKYPSSMAMRVYLIPDIKEKIRTLCCING